jgi:adenosylcobinamide-phosphate guanylyltransferase
VIVVTSPNTPSTTRWAKNSGIKVITAPGQGYIRDYGWAIKRLRLRGPVLIISADLPLITHQLIDRIIDYHAEAQKPALTVCIPYELCKATKQIPDLTIEASQQVLIPTGVNVVDGDLINDVQEEVILVIRDQALLHNINRRTDLERLPNE